MKNWKAETVAVLVGALAIGCGGGKKDQIQYQSYADLMRAWDDANDPSRMGLTRYDYEAKFERLPLEAHLPSTPWSGDYWPTYKGGISYRWNHASDADSERIYYNLLSQSEIEKVDTKGLSPAEKWDIFTNDAKWGMTQSERKRTNVFSQLEGEEIESWWGLCHAWAPATLLFKNPSPVTASNDEGVVVEFGSSDIKALLTLYMHHHSKTEYFASRRCNIDDLDLRRRLESGEMSRSDFNEVMDSSECRGINAGSFHVLLGNLIGLQDKGFIADIDRDAEVWNQSVSGYRSRVLQTNRWSHHPDAAPGTEKEIKVETIMTYTNEVGHTWKKSAPASAQATKRYVYWLELDRRGRVIGGRWESYERPDFLWRQNLPDRLFTGYWKPLRELVERSIGVWDASESDTESCTGEDCDLDSDTEIATEYSDSDSSSDSITEGTDATLSETMVGSDSESVSESSSDTAYASQTQFASEQMQEQGGDSDSVTESSSSDSVTEQMGEQGGESNSVTESSSSDSVTEQMDETGEQGGDSDSVTEQVGEQGGESNSVTESSSSDSVTEQMDETGEQGGDSDSVTEQMGEQGGESNSVTEQMGEQGGDSDSVTESSSSDSVTEQMGEQGGDSDSVTEQMGEQGGDSDSVTEQMGEQGGESNSVTEQMGEQGGDSDSVTESSSSDSVTESSSSDSVTESSSSDSVTEQMGEQEPTSSDSSQFQQFNQESASESQQSEQSQNSEDREAMQQVSQQTDIDESQLESTQQEKTLPFQASQFF